MTTSKSYDYLNRLLSISSVGGSATRKGEYFWKEVSAANSSAALWLGITNTAIYSAQTNTVSGSLFVPQTPEVFTYDADGNLTNDGRWVYTWDGENRLLQMESLTGNPTSSKRKVVYTYDHLSRMIARKSYTGASGSYVVLTDTKFLFDGWRQVAELNATNNSLVRGFTWGLDLSGSMEGAGGIGGLILLTDSGSSTSHFYSYDGNGNVSALVKATDSTKTAEYEYGPFGEVIRASGTIATSNPFRFSSKAQDAETELLYYGYRFYNAATGRWPNRDPIGEKGGSNLYGFVHNNPISKADKDGRIFEGDVEAPPANNLNPPPSGPFQKCAIALRCKDVMRVGVLLGTHCGLVVDTGNGVYDIDGSGGPINSRWVTPGSPLDATGSWTDNDPSICECLFGNISSWNNRNVPRNNECANSNWNLKCGLKKCNVQVNWGSQSKPMGFDCKDCVRSARVGAVPPGAFACDRCLEWQDKPCPDQ